MHRSLFALALLALGWAPPLTAGLLGGGEYIATVSSGCALCAGTELDSFGTTSWGGPFAVPGFNGSAQTAWFGESFGMLARADGNNTGAGGTASAYAYGYLYEPILIRDPLGIRDGEAGVFSPNYHLDGAVNIDWTGYNAPGSDNLGGQVDLAWRFGSFDNPEGSGNATYAAILVNEHWVANQLTAQVDREVSPSVPFVFGEIFYYTYIVELKAFVTSANPPSFGYAQGDFLHTGKLTGATVFDKDGNPVADPIIISESGIDFVNPGAPAVPLPPTIWLLGTGIVGLGGRRWLRRKSQDFLQGSARQKGNAPPKRGMCLASDPG